MKYPFIPKSNKSLTAGDYWIIKLENGNYAVGLVVDIPEIKTKLRMEFIAGLLDYSNSKKPELEDLLNARIVKQGKTHVKTIGYTGKEIVGNINLESNGIEPLIQRSQIGFQPDAWIVRGYRRVRNMKRDDVEKYSVLGGWGFDMIKIFAEENKN